MIQKKWFRIETGADGAVLSCEEVEANGRNGAVVRFYEAADKADACSAAKQWWEKTKIRRSAREHRKRTQKKRDGLCQTSGCNSATRPGKAVCQTCQDRSSRRAIDIRERKNAGAFTDKRLRYSSTEEAARVGYERELERNRQRRARGEKSVYQWMLNRFDEMGAPAFRAWLVSKIPAMQQQPAKEEWHPPMAYEPMAQAAE